MKKAKLLSGDGSEFTVFFLKSGEDKQEVVASDNLNEMDVNENSCGFTDKVMKEILKQDLENFLVSKKSTLNKYDDPYFFDPLPMIDDTIESDIVKSPEVNELYRVRGLNKIARFKGHSQVSGVVTKRYFQMSCHGQEFHVEDNSLLKVKQIEIDIYMGKAKGL